MQPGANGRVRVSCEQQQTGRPRIQDVQAAGKEPTRAPIEANWTFEEVKGKNKAQSTRNTREDNVNREHEGGNRQGRVRTHRDRTGGVCTVHVKLSTVGEREREPFGKLGLTKVVCARTASVSTTSAPSTQHLSRLGSILLPGSIPSSTGAQGSKTRDCDAKGKRWHTQF